MRLPNRPFTQVAWIVTIVGLLLMVVDVLWVYLNPLLAERYHAWTEELIFILPSALSLVIGGFITVRKPDNPIGWLWICFSYAFGPFLGLLQLYANFGLLVASEIPPLSYFAAFMGDMSWAIGLVILSFVMLLFPTGHLLSPRWKYIAYMILICILLGFIVDWISPGDYGSVSVENPYALQGSLGKASLILENVVIGLLFVGLVASALSVILRYRRSRGIEHQQMKWFAYGASLFGIILILQLALSPRPGLLLNILNTVMLTALPVTTGIAITRHRLWDIDVVIRKTLVYGALTLTLALVYIGSVILLQSIVTIIGGQRSAVITVISTLLIAALFTPLRRRIQNDIDQRFYRKKYDSEKTIAAFSSSLRNEVELAQLTNRIVSVVEETIQPEFVSLWLRAEKSHEKSRLS